MEQTPFEVKENTGTIWMEVQTRPGTQGDYQVRNGTMKIAGKEYFINAYEKVTQTGKTILSLTFKEKQTKSVADPNTPPF